MASRRLGAAVVVAVVFGGAMAVAPAATVGAVGPCAASATRVFTGAQPAFTETLAANERVDATSATWTGTVPYPVYFDSNADSCWNGGVIKGTFPVSTTWNVYHDTAGFGVAGKNFTLNAPRIFNYGDGIRIRDNADGFSIQSAYLAYIHDDCIENDRLVSGTVDDSFLDGCYVGFSTRQSSGNVYDGRLNTMTIKNSLVRLQAMPTVYSGTAAGHGGFFKWDTSGGTSPGLNITNTIFRADQTTNHQNLNLPAGYPVSCSNNTMVWLGPGAFPGTLPSCFIVTTERSVWDAAVRAWDIAHPGVVTGPEVSIGDASMREPHESTRLLRFPLTLSTPPGDGNTVSVYWSTAPGTAGSSDFTPTKGKAVFTGSQVYKTITVPVKPDALNESNELMYLVVAGVDGGENHRERGVGTIVDDSGSTLDLSISDALLVEGDLGTRSLVVPIVLTNPAPADVLITWSTQSTGSATAGVDYSTRSGTAKIALGYRQWLLTIPIPPDFNSEGTETFQIVISSSAPGVTLVDGTGVVTIRDDD